MDWTKLVTILFIFSQLSCENKSKSATNTPPQYLADSLTNTALKVYSAIELKQFWDSLCHKKGCLTGGQYVHRGEFGGEGCAFSIDEQWKDFLFKTDKKQLAAFLIQQIPNTSETQTHACPVDLANKGELAIYCLQGISKSNFYDLSPELIALKDKKIYRQKWIRDIQNSKKQRDNLQQLWTEKFDF